MAATIKDIAKMVGVNPSTVSRVINGTASISEETKQKIREAMEQLDYHPNSNARSLVNGSTFTIGLVIDALNSEAFSNDFFIRSVSAIEAVAQEKGFNLLICSDRNSNKKNSIEDLVYEKKVDGIILPVSVVTKSLIDLLDKHNFPFVIMGIPELFKDKTSWVDMDNAFGSRAAVNHLFDRGYKHPALLVEDRGKSFEKNRIYGYEKGIEDYTASAHCDNHPGFGPASASGTGRTQPSTLIFESDLLRESLVKDIENYLTKFNEIDCFICTNNDVAFSALTALKHLNRKVPEDFGIITFDNFPLAAYMNPPLSVVDVDTYKLGEEAANMLFSILRESSDRLRHILIPTTLIKRESTAKK